MATSGSKPPSLPPLPTDLDPQLRNYLKQVDTHLKVKAGDSGNPKDRNLTLRDLEESGIVSSAPTVNDFSITAGDPTVKFVAPNQLITEQVGEENTSKKFSKTGIIFASDFNSSTTVGSAQHSGLTDFNFLFNTSGSFGYPNNHMVGSHPNSGFKYQLFSNLTSSFSFKTPVHARGGKKPYLISFSGDKSGGVSSATPIDVVVVHVLLLSGPLSGSTHSGHPGVYNTVSGTNLQPNEGEFQISRRIVAGGGQAAAAFLPMNVETVVELREQQEYIIHTGVGMIGVTGTQAIEEMQYTVQGLTT